MSDIVLRGGRVIDPETGLDAIRDVMVTDGRVTGVEPGRRAQDGIDVSGLVVTAGFIDLHSHVPDIPGARLQALDGVTTALELEAGAIPVARAYERAAAEGRPVNFGFSASWAAARMLAVAGIEVNTSTKALLGNIGNPAWQQAATARQTEELLGLLAGELADGALGIGVLLGYANDVSPDEYLAVARLAAQVRAPVYTHARSLIESVPDVLVDGAEEIVRAAGETGAHMHYCHVNSTSARHTDRVLALVERARNQGATVTTEAYPYGSGMTGIGAAFLAPERLHERGLTPRSLTYVPTGERIATAARLAQLRHDDPGGLALIETLSEDDENDRALLMRSLTFPGAVVASDAMPLTWTGRPPAGDPWPLPATAVTHPRSAGTFSRSVRMLTRDEHGLSLSDVLAKCSLLPARILEARVPAMRGKGRLRAGADADIVVFDPAAITDRATYASSTVPSEGIRHVLVNGTFVVRDGNLVPGALPGKAVRA
jgi:N-acyl-D-aspartate/D-glutamate deacylase